jgi:hypothetical protein
LISHGSHAKRGFEITLRPHYYKVFVEGSGEALFTKRASPVNAYISFTTLLPPGDNSARSTCSNGIQGEAADGTETKMPVHIVILETKLKLKTSAAPRACLAVRGFMLP